MTTLGEQDEAACAALMKDMPGAKHPEAHMGATLPEYAWEERKHKISISPKKAAEVNVTATPRPDADAILRAAQHAVVDRGQTHGDKGRGFAHAARLWSADLGVAITPEQVAWCMVLLKRARAANGEFNADDYVDAAGYAGIAGELA